LEFGADINALATHTKGITALQAAIINRDLELVLYLLERNTKVDSPDAAVDSR
jgi:ankyrin repeat protein